MRTRSSCLEKHIQSYRGCRASRRLEPRTLEMPLLLIVETPLVALVFAASLQGSPPITSHIAHLPPARLDTIQISRPHNAVTRPRSPAPLSEYPLPWVRPYRQYSIITIIEGLPIVQSEGADSQHINKIMDVPV
ncbi:hypothetical protein CC78DRAFT_573190 [Lojkania enalia]|uniref:Uncharacterized protein n=1 Tax=Lojkania enalia TaxID=147567 RepID=A0A9P4TRV9_9PLEO|nr:hypothetical protein CC78DRAFT_573190 [Didymosphaeria enalia]